MPAEIPLELERAGRMRWLIKLRWLAVLGVLTVAGVAAGFLSLDLPLEPIGLIAGGIAAYNALFAWGARRIERAEFRDARWRPTGDQFVHIQIGLDWLALTLLIHFSGGLENPFLWYFVFHGILASILLRRRASYGQALLAMSLVTGLGLLEYFHLVPHVPVGGFLTTPLYDQAGYVLGVLVAFSTALFVVVYLTGAIMATLRAREARLVELQEALQTANRDLQAQDRLKSEYVLLVAHNLRSPLAAISSLVALVLGGLVGETTARTREVLERANRRVLALSQLVRDLLDLSRMRAGQALNLERIHWPDFLEVVLDEVRVQAEEKGIELKAHLSPDLPRLIGDPELLAQAVINLLTNAIKYTPPGGHVRVGAEGDGQSIRLTVSDDGIGIPEEARPHLFQDFYRAPNAQESGAEGTGLGLSLVKDIVARHGGQVEVESEEGHGSTFTLILPLRAEEGFSAAEHGVIKAARGEGNGPITDSGGGR